MAFCNNCGTQIDDDTRFCPSCGADQTPQAQQTQETPQAEPGAQGKAEDAWKKFSNTTDTSAEYDMKDVEDNKIMALLAYLGILFLVPLLGAPNSKFARFHANQGIVLFIATIAYSIIYFILSAILSYIPVLGFIIILILGILWIVPAIFAILGIINAVGGKAKELPIIGKIRVLK